MDRGPPGLDNARMGGRLNNWTIDTRNDFAVGMQNALFVMLRPPGATFSREQAIRLAAYLVAMADGEAFSDFVQTLEAVRAT